MLSRWNSPYGYREILKISMPLVASMASTTVMLFTDRMFLGWYSMDSIAAATPAGLSAFMFMCFFLGVGSYTNTFIAQYTGSGEPHRVGASLWQGIYFTLASGIILALLSFMGDPLFRWSNHPPEVLHLEIIYFRILMLFSIINVLHNVLSCFYSGRGFTKTIMLVSFIGASLNVPLDYALIHGKWGFPELGITGAAYATVIGHLIILILYVFLIFRPKNNREFNVMEARRFDPDLFKRLMKYGLPAGISFFIDIFAFTFFLYIVGRVGKMELAASNIAFAISTLGFLPMIGFGIGTSTLVGQAIGRGTPEDGVTATYSALHICFIYMVTISLLYVIMPEWLFNLFKPGDFLDTDYRSILQMGRILLVFMAFFSIFDTGNIIFASAIKGAGDTRFVTRTVASMSTIIMVLPVYISVTYFGAGIYTAWSFVTTYVILVALVFWWRFRQGKWKSMRVIEQPSAEMRIKGHIYQ